MFNELRIASTIISMEAVSGMAAADRAAERIPTFLESAGEYLTRNIFQPLSNLFASKDLSWLANEMQRKPYGEMRAIKIATPPKFKGNIATYGTKLYEAAKAMDGLHDDVLAPLDAWVNLRLGNPDSLKSLTNTLKIPGLENIKVDTLNRGLDQYFPDKRSQFETALYGECFARQSDWRTIAENVRDFNTLYANGNFEKVARKQKELTISLQLLAKRVGDHPEEYKLSSVTTEQLSKVVLGVAQQIEFYGLLRTRVDEYMRMVSDNMTLMQHYLKGNSVSMEELTDSMIASYAATETLQPTEEVSMEGFFGDQIQKIKEIFGATPRNLDLLTAANNLFDRGSMLAEFEKVIAKHLAMKYPGNKIPESVQMKVGDVPAYHVVKNLWYRGKLDFKNPAAHVDHALTEISKQMAEVRREMDVDVKFVVEGAKKVMKNQPSFASQEKRTAQFREDYAKMKEDYPGAVVKYLNNHQVDWMSGTFAVIHEGRLVEASGKRANSKAPEMLLIPALTRSQAEDMLKVFQKWVLRGEEFSYRSKIEFDYPNYMYQWAEQFGDEGKSFLHRCDEQAFYQYYRYMYGVWSWMTALQQMLFWLGSSIVDEKPTK